jgi:hypothetical protein
MAVMKAVVRGGETVGMKAVAKVVLSVAVTDFEKAVSKAALSAV